MIFLRRDQLDECTQIIQEAVRDYLNDDRPVIERGEDEKGSFWRCPNISESLDALSDEEVGEFANFFQATLTKAVERVAKHFRG